VTAADEFRRCFEDFDRPLWQAVAASFGPEAADDAVAETWAYAWSHWERLAPMDNLRGYLYVAAKRYAHRARPRRSGALPAPAVLELPDVEPGLIDALNALSEKQRVAVFLVEACQWRATEVAELLDVSVSTVRNHLARGLAHLRKELEVELDAQP
jgi:DNA-directed RNA polymerase specialized sigma24 family protein